MRLLALTWLSVVRPKAILMMLWLLKFRDMDYVLDESDNLVLSEYMVSFFFSNLVARSSSASDRSYRQFKSSGSRHRQSNDLSVTFVGRSIVKHERREDSSESRRLQQCNHFKCEYISYRLYRADSSGFSTTHRRIQCTVGMSSDITTGIKVELSFFLHVAECIVSCITQSLCGESR